MKRDIIVVGASAGGVQALKSLSALFPADLDASVFVVLHLDPSGSSVLPAILRRHCSLDVTSAVDGASIETGRMYVAPNDRHLVLDRGVMRLTTAPPVNGSRPSIDALFVSAAAAYGDRVAGVVLSGLLDDGTDGLVEIKRAGGVAIVQDPRDADYPSMPQHAIDLVGPHMIGYLPEIAAFLIGLTKGTEAPPAMLRNLGIASGRAARIAEVERQRSASAAAADRRVWP